MRKSSALLALMIFCSPVWAEQQNSAPASQPSFNISMITKALTIGRKDTFNSGMSAYLNQGEMEKFWPIYANYEKERGQLDKEIVNLLQRLANTYEKLDDQQSVKVVNDSAALQQKSLAMRTKYFNLIAKAISGKAAARFYQIDDFISTVMRLQVLDTIPLFGDKLSQ